MTRSLFVLLVILGVGGCAGVPMLAESCAIPVAQPEETNELPDRLACSPRAAEHALVAHLGSVRQTGTQTSTVGVPRGFLVAMLVLILLVSLA